MKEAATGDGSVRPWHDYNWEEVLAGAATAARYFVRSGLVRKDKLSRFAPRGCHPPTAVVRSFAELQAGLRTLGCGNEDNQHGVRYVLKKAHSSNAYGIRFITEREARAIVDPGVLRGAAIVSVATAVVALRTLRDRRSRGAWIQALVLFAWLWLAGIRLVRRRRNWLSKLDSWRDHELWQASPQSENVQQVWVLQRNVETWLYDGCKFHLRALFLCVGDLKAYVHEDVRMLLATSKYEEGSSDGKRMDVHITNMGANLSLPGYEETSHNLGLKVLGEELAANVFQQVVEVLGVTITNLRAAGRRHFFALPNCWELFGADLLLDRTGSVILLEINPSPSLAMYGEGTSVQCLVGLAPLLSVPAGWHSVWNSR
mmetsp:Transcript_8381/g.19791  ORF Transcript_8381/g.19791 Transcript_8381/m.19791 type:complete len:372 (+) Transcript_8381:8-1123(+)